MKAEIPLLKEQVEKLKKQQIDNESSYIDKIVSLQTELQILKQESKNYNDNGMLSSSGARANILILNK